MVTVSGESDPPSGAAPRTADAAGEIPAGKRLDGWKAIAGYFKRDRSTVMRWAAERDLPVRRMPGGKQGSVFALEHELAAWALDPAKTAAAVVAEPAPAEPAPAKPRKFRLGLVVLAAAAVVLAVLAAVWLAGPKAPAPARLAMPRSPEVARTYVLARDTWARRTPADIARSIDLYRDVVRREPDFAPAYAGLADAWLLYREYGEIDDMRGYGEARQAAEQALARDPRLPGAHRAMGFIQYWWDNDPARALAGFERALALDDRDAQTHFWYANVLADLGLNARAEQAYDRARLIAPDSAIIAVEQACFQATAGRGALGRTQLLALAQRRPNDPTIHSCLAWIAIGEGDMAATASEYAKMARLRGEPGLNRLSAQLNAAVARDPGSAHRVLISDQRQEIANGTRRVRLTPAYVASSMGDREALVPLLREASALGERWYTAGMTGPIAARWAGDHEIRELMLRLRQPAPAVPDQP